MSEKLKQILIARNKSAKQRAAVSKHFFQDLAGKKFNRLKVLEYFGKTKLGQSKWKCLCDCGKISFPTTGKLRGGQTKSCGCYSKSMLGNRQRTHGMRNTRFYMTFARIKERCNNPKRPKYRIYGGRGIKCLWNSFEEFRDDMYKSYEEHVQKFGIMQTSIDRIDVNGHYEKSNCRWATKKEQGRNTRFNHMITFNGETHCMADWADKVGISQGTLERRINAQKWSVEKALTTPIKR